MAAATGWVFLALLGGEMGIFGIIRSLGVSVVASSFTLHPFSLPPSLSLSSSSPLLFSFSVRVSTSSQCLVSAGYLFV